jgi:CheY-like chemotaxis protein
LVSDEVRVVVIDDVSDAAQALALALQLDGYDVRTADNGVDALALIESFQPHCVLLDIEMPQMDGCELSKRLRLLYGDDIVLVAVTGWSENNERVAESFGRVDHYLRKPIDYEKLQVILPSLNKPAQGEARGDD